MELKRHMCVDTPEIRVHGRISDRKTEGIPLFWTGSAIEFSVTGSEARLEYDCRYYDRESYIRIELDGADMYRFMLEEGRHTVNIFRGFPSDTVKNVRIFRETQASDTTVQMIAIECDGEFKPLPKRLKLEVLGDSVTSGEGLAGAKCHEAWIPAIFSSRGEYGVLAAKELDMDWSIVALSGWGFYCTWNNNPNGNIPSIYEYVCGDVKGDAAVALGSRDLYSFEKNPADITVVNLGSNDGGAIGGEIYTAPDGTKHQLRTGEDGRGIHPEDAEKLENAIKGTLDKIRSYRPEAKIVWCYNMLNDKLNDMIVRVCGEYSTEKNDKNIYTLELPRSPEELKGARFHPGAGAHRLFADALEKKLKEII